MATANVTLSLDPAVIEMAKAQARAAGLSMSAWVAAQVRAATIREAARRCDEYDREHPEEMSAMAAWDEANAAEQAARWSGAEW